MLVGIFADDSKNRSIRNLAGEALAKVSIQDGRNTSTILQLNGDLVGTLIKILLVDDAENKTCRIRAAQILEQMCVLECTPGKLNDAMTDAMPKVLAQIYLLVDRQKIKHNQTRSNSQKKKLT